MATKKELETVRDRRNEKIQSKLKIWKLLSDSYKGGEEYIRSGHLWQYPRENTIEFSARKRRAVYFNHVQPLADILAGFLFEKLPERKIPDNLQYMVTNASKGKSLDSFMHTVSIQSLLYTVGVLVDSPEFDEADAPTLADRNEQGLNPYCVLYYPNKIRDFYVNDNQELEWLLLDNTETKKESALSEPETITKYRLWTKTEYQDFTFYQDDKKSGNDSRNVGVADEPVSHGIGEIPFIFVNWRDIDSDNITESVFEDIALLDKQIFNCLSYFDEMLAAGSFKNLFFPISSADDIPDDIIKGGVGSLSVIPFPSDSSKGPFYAGAELSDIGSFVTGIDLYLREIFSKIGMNEDRDKTYVQSGVAKSLEFSKCESLLKLGSEQMKGTEEKIFYFAAKWEQNDSTGVKINYPKTFITEDIDIELSRLYQLYAYPFKTLKEETLSQIVRKVLTGIDNKRMKEILKEIEKGPETVPVIEKAEIDNLTNQEKEMRDTTNEEVEE